MTFDLLTLHSTWQEKWHAANLFSPTAGLIPAGGVAQDKFYLTAAFPYPNSPQHIGHARTYTTTDIYARFKRLTGQNVLFPMAFHVTGTPILGMAKRIGAKDPELFDIFDKIYGISPSITSTLTDPRELVLYFSREIEAGMKEMGYSIDWRRKFYTFDAVFNKFVQWQFRRLHAAGLIVKGTHPVPWCPSDKQPVGGHDTRGDVDPQLEEVTAVLFQAGEGFIPTITYRPETLPGVTNLWVNPGGKYVLAEWMARGPEGAAPASPQKLYLSLEALESLSSQLILTRLREVPASELLALRAIHPIDGRSLPILPATFVKPDVGTGLVMSVPAHAPLDYLALRDGGWLEGESPPASSSPSSAIALDASSSPSALRFKPIQVLRTPGFDTCPAGELVARMGIASQSDPRSEEATKLLYKTEAHEAKMLDAPYAGMLGAQAKEKIKAELNSSGKALSLHILANSPVFCRCGARCTVGLVDNQWFINYGDESWKGKTREALSSMRIQPESLRHEYEYTIGWLKEKACTRASGLGTRFPLDETQMIEALSDSTLYMAYYTIAPLAQKMGADALSDGFFDYALLGIEPADASKKTADWMAARSEFLYWYPLDSRHSAHDLVHNHLTFFLFNHTGVFSDGQKGPDGGSRPAPTFWPRQTVSNGFVTMDGKKMSKSMGNILPLRRAIAQYGPDVIRFVVTSSAELEADSDFNQSSAIGVSARLLVFYAKLEALSQPGYTPVRGSIGSWFYSRFHRRLRAARGQYEDFQMRPLAQAILYDTYNDLQAYCQKTRTPDLREFFEYWTLLSAPFMPHAAEEFWKALGPKKHVKDAPFAASARFPEADDSKIDDRIERQWEYLGAVEADIAHILKLLKREKASKVTIIVHAPWKAKVRALVATHKQMNVLMAAAKADAELAPLMPKVSALAARLLKNIGSVSGEALSASDELDAFEAMGGRAELERSLGASVVVMREEDAPPALAAKSANALPGKPSLLIE